MSTRVLLVDDEQLFREGLHLLIEERLGMTVAGETDTGAGALALLKKGNIDIVLMDLHLPDINGIEASRRLLEQDPHIKIIVLSSDSDPARVDDALLAGVMGYVLKSNAASEVQRAVQSVSEGKRYLSPDANDSLLTFYSRLRLSPVGITRPELSPREKEVLRLIAEGHRTKEIAGMLNLSVKSAETYRQRIMNKLNLFSVAELTRYAVREGLTRL